MSETTVTIRTSNARLLKLAAFLRELPRKRFDYSVFVGDDWKGAPDLSCGTVACALGWATTIPSIRKAGLYLDQGGSPMMRQGPANAFYAGAEVFGITLAESHELFTANGGEYNATPKYVAKKIERFVAKRGQKASKDKQEEKR